MCIQSLVYPHDKIRNMLLNCPQTSPLKSKHGFSAIISKVKTAQYYIILYFSLFPTPRVTRADINRNTDLDLNAFVAAISESPGWFYQTIRGRMGRKRKWPPGSEFIAESVEAKQLNHLEGL